MSYTYHGTANLIALPNRTVQTYPSGLVRVERSFVCRKGDVEKFRSRIKVNEPMPSDDGAPAIDGLYIFPEPQEIVRDDGFVEFRVTAYGRTGVFREISFDKISAKGSYSFIINTPDAFSISTPAAINEIYTFRGVLESSASISSVIATPSIDKLTVIDLSTGRVLEDGVVGKKNTTVKLNFDSLSSINFGLWVEYSASWQTAATVVQTS